MKPYKHTIWILFVLSTFLYGQREDGEISWLTRSTNQKPCIAFDGTNYLVVWQCLQTSDYDIHGKRINPDAVIIDTTSITISTAQDHQSSPSITFDGTNYFVAWGDRRGGPFDGIYGARVSPDGNVLDPDGLPLSFVGGIGQQRPAVDFGVSNYLVVWEDLRNGQWFDIFGTRVVPDGTVLDSIGIQLSTWNYHEDHPSVSFDGTNFMVTWMDERTQSATSYDIYGTRVSQGGIVLDPAGIAISTYSDVQQRPVVAFDGNNYFVVWHDSRSGESDIYGARVTTDGTVQDTIGIAISIAGNYQSHPAVAFGDSIYLVVWQDDRIATGTYDLYFSRVTPSGTVLDPGGIILSNALNQQVEPAGAFDGTNFLVAWTDTRNSVHEIYYARIDQSGQVLDPEGILLTAVQEHPMYDHGSSPRLQVYPNPFHGRLHITYDIGISTINNNALCKIMIYDITGRLIWESANINSNKNHIIWNGHTTQNIMVPSGIYFVVLQTASHIYTKQVLLIR